MTPSRTVLTLSTLALTLGLGTAAHAEDDLALSFELQPNSNQDTETANPTAVMPTTVPSLSASLSPTEAPLPVPPLAINPPLAEDATLPAGVYGGVDALALSSGQSLQAQLPAPPPAPAALAALPPAEPVATAPPTAPEIVPTEDIDHLLLGVNFRLPPQAQPTTAVETAPPPAASAPAVPTAVAAEANFSLLSTLFAGGTESLVARAVGSAEGTRTPEGHKTPAYFGHVDPGNGVWNLGTFSYQHGAHSPEEADAKQLARLKSQTQTLKQIAEANGLELSTEELLNGIDLANQAPLAALDRGGYLDWLAEAQRLGMEGSEAIVYARTRAFIDPDTQRWNAPGLGNNIHSIYNDQARRSQAIARALAVQAPPATAADTPAPTEEPQPSAPIPVREAIGFSLDTWLQEAPSAIAAPTAATPAPASGKTPRQAVDAQLPLEISAAPPPRLTASPAPPATGTHALAPAAAVPPAPVTATQPPEPALPAPRATATGAPPETRPATRAEDTGLTFAATGPLPAQTAKPGQAEAAGITAPAPEAGPVADGTTPGSQPHEPEPQVRATQPEPGDVIAPPAASPPSSSLPGSTPDKTPAGAPHSPLSASETTLPEAIAEPPIAPLPAAAPGAVEAPATSATPTQVTGGAPPTQPLPKAKAKREKALPAPFSQPHIFLPRFTPDSPTQPRDR